MQNQIKIVNPEVSTITHLDIYNRVKTMKADLDSLTNLCFLYHDMSAAEINNISTSIDIAETHLAKINDRMCIYDNGNNFTHEKSTNKRERGEYPTIIDLVENDDDNSNVCHSVIDLVSVSDSDEYKTINSANIITTKRQRTQILTNVVDDDLTDISQEEEEDDEDWIPEIVKVDFDAAGNSQMMLNSLWDHSIYN
jgi:hypothetical protein